MDKAEYKALCDKGTMTNAEYKAVRLYLGYTQEELAAALHIDRRTIIARESGDTVIREEAIRAILSLKPKQAK